MNGWYRLWVVVSALIGFVILFAAIDDAPSKENCIERPVDGDRYLIKPPYGEEFDLEVPKGMSRADALSWARAIQAGDIRLCPTLRDYIEHYSKFVTAWVVTISSLYLFGAAVAWVRRGFRGNKA